MFQMISSIAIKYIRRFKKFWNYQKVEHLFCAGFPLADPVKKKSIARSLGTITQVFAVISVLLAFSYAVIFSDVSNVAIYEWIDFFKVLFLMYTIIILTPRVIFLIPAIINMYLNKEKYFYTVMIGVSLVALSVFKLSYSL